MKTPDGKDMNVLGKMPEEKIKKSEQILRYYVQGATDAYATHLAFGGKADQEQEDYIIALDDGAHALACIQQLESQVPKWISVEEMLPEKSSESNGTWYSDTVLATTAGYILFGYFNVYKHNGTWEFICIDDDMDSDICVTVTHWMPLPEPPKEE